MSRAYCYKCNRAEKTCLCNKISIINNDINVYILQHSDEVNNAKGTAIIAGLYVKNCTIWRADSLEHKRALAKLIARDGNNTYVVYPDKNSISLECWAKALKFQRNKIAAGKYNLLFIDASWRKAVKIWNSFLVFKSIPCIKLTQAKVSNYRIRKIPETGYLSTIETIVACLAAGERSADKYQPLLNVFDEMIDTQIKNMGEKIYVQNYQK